MSISQSIRHTFITLIFSYFSLFPAIAQSRKEERAFQEAVRYYEAGIRQSDNLQKQRYTSYAIGLYTKYLRSHAGSKTSQRPDSIWVMLAKPSGKSKKQKTLTVF